MNTLAVRAVAARTVAAVLIAALSALPACAPAAGGRSGVAEACDNTGFLRDRAQPPPVAAEVTVCGPVASVRSARRTRSGTHQYFLVAVTGARPIEIVVNEDELGGPLPLRTGQRALVHGRYYRDPDGHEGIDWTHHGASRSWPYPGYVVLDGRTFQ